MKKVILPITILAGLLMSFAFTGNGPCNSNDFFIAGTKSKMGFYKPDGEQTGTSSSTVTDVGTSGDSTIATVSTTYTSAKKSEEPRTNSMRMICVNDELIMDMSAAMNSMAPGKDMTIVMKGNKVPFKTSYTAGQKLEDVIMTSEVYSGGKLMMTTEVHVTDRVVEAIEDRTTPAGTFHCFRISSITTATSKMGTMNMPGGKPSKTVQWYSPRAGMVRMENYKEDKMQSYDELLELVKP